MDSHSRTASRWMSEPGRDWVRPWLFLGLFVMKYQPAIAVTKYWKGVTFWKFATQTEQWMGPPNSLRALVLDEGSTLYGAFWPGL
jgi:hypothetical protein